MHPPESVLIQIGIANLNDTRRINRHFSANKNRLHFKVIRVTHTTESHALEMMCVCAYFHSLAVE